MSSAKNVQCFIRPERNPPPDQAACPAAGRGRESLYLLSETDLEDIIEAVHQVKPDILIVDSIRMSIGSTDTTPGSISQVKQCTTALMNLAKSEDVTILLSAISTKRIYCRGQKYWSIWSIASYILKEISIWPFRILRAGKIVLALQNGSVYLKCWMGLRDPESFRNAVGIRPENAPGNCVTCVMKESSGACEIQALLAPSSYSNPRRTSNGIEYNRAMLLLAILEKRRPVGWRL